MSRFFIFKSIFWIMLLLSGNLIAQKVTKETALEVCRCIEEKKEELQKDSKSKMVEMHLGLCMFSAFSKTDNSVGVDLLLDEDRMEKLGEEVAMLMLSVCPETLMSLTEFLADDFQDFDISYKEVEGDITDIKEQQFMIIEIKDVSKRMHQFLFLEYFENADQLITKQIKKNDRVVVTYKEIELYDPKLGDYRMYKIIADIAKK